MAGREVARVVGRRPRWIGRLVHLGIWMVSTIALWIVGVLALFVWLASANGELDALSCDRPARVAALSRDIDWWLDASLRKSPRCASQTTPVALPAPSESLVGKIDYADKATSKAEPADRAEALRILLGMIGVVLASLVGALTLSATMWRTLEATLDKAVDRTNESMDTLAARAAGLFAPESGEREHAVRSVAAIGLTRRHEASATTLGEDAFHAVRSALLSWTHTQTPRGDGACGRGACDARPAPVEAATAFDVLGRHLYGIARRDGVDRRLHDVCLTGMAVLRETAFDGWLFENVCLREARLQHTQLGRTVWKVARFDSARLEAVDLRAARFEEAAFASAQLKDCDLRQVSMVGVQCKGVRLDTVRADGADLSDGAFANANLTKVALRDANLKGAHFENAQLDRVDLRRATLEDVDFARANFTNCNFRNVRRLSPMQLTFDQIDGATFQSIPWSVRRDMTPPANHTDRSFPALRRRIWRRIRAMIDRQP